MAYVTEDNLREAFAVESQAERRYTFFAEKAAREGYPQVARLFRAVAAAETIHARNHLNAMDAIGATKDNLLAASMGERQEFTYMYPAFVEKAELEKNDRAERTFRWAGEVEKAHHAHFEAALAALKKGKAPEDAAYYVCRVCGNTVTGQPPGKCPVCGAPGKAFEEVG